ncbi:hypothetical protein BJ878DRAFT_521329 [Calycina marina]|uniref:Uncharacterized protein n=1 Tax=Calycina marina TaxID=1763456 RepID=A0A9P8CC74_9HELO|nr:hypothetical protein BJ878DRAFT_521329 [Calycina marina]
MSSSCLTGAAWTPAGTISSGQRRHMYTIGDFMDVHMDSPCVKLYDTDRMGLPAYAMELCLLLSRSTPKCPVRDTYKHCLQKPDLSASLSKRKSALSSIRSKQHTAWYFLSINTMIQYSNGQLFIPIASTLFHPTGVLHKATFIQCVYVLPAANPHASIHSVGTSESMPYLLLANRDDRRKLQ